uniref:SAM domain-containing protein n=1 Tax=Eptatretus burgeri TaxID=7764 RepID=A0A8C4R5V7_EPTBU
MMIEGKDQGEAVSGAETVVLRRPEKNNDCDGEKNYGSHVRRIKSMFLMDDKGQTRRPVLAPKPWGPCRSSIILEASHSGAHLNIPAEADAAQSPLEHKFTNTRKVFEKRDGSTQKKDVDTGVESVSKPVSRRPTSLHTTRFSASGDSELISPTSRQFAVSPENAANSLSSKDEAGRSNVDHTSQTLDPFVNVKDRNDSRLILTSANQPVIARAKLGETAQREIIAEQLEACDSSSPSYVSSEQPTSPTLASFPKRVRQYSLECPRPFKLQHDAHPVKWTKKDSPVSPGSMRNRSLSNSDATFPILTQLQSSKEIKPVDVDQMLPDKLQCSSGNDDILKKEYLRGEQGHTTRETIEVVPAAHVPKQRATVLVQQRNIDDQDDSAVEQPLETASDVGYEGMEEKKIFSDNAQTDKGVTAINEAAIGPTAILPEETSVSLDGKNDLSVDEEHDHPDKMIPEFPVCTSGKVHGMDDVGISHQPLPLESEGTRENTPKHDDEEKSEENKKKEKVPPIVEADCLKEGPFHEDKVDEVKVESLEIQGKVSSFLEEEDKVSPDDDSRTMKETKSFDEVHPDAQPIATPTELEVGDHQKSMTSEDVNLMDINLTQSRDTSLQMPSKCHLVEPISENANQGKVLKDDEWHFPEESATVHDSDAPSQKDIIPTPNEPSGYAVTKDILQNKENKTKVVVFDEISSCKKLDTCQPVEVIVTSDKELAEVQITKSRSSSTEETEAHPEKNMCEDNVEKSDDERRSITSSNVDVTVTLGLEESDAHLRTSLDLQKPSHLENSPPSPGDEQCHEPNDGIKVEKIKEINMVAAGDELQTSPEEVVLMSPAEDGIDVVPTKTIENDVCGDGETRREQEVPSENGDNGDNGKNDLAVQAEKSSRGKEDEEPQETDDASPKDGRTDDDDDGIDNAGVEKSILEDVVVSTESECAERSQEAPDELSEDVQTVEAKEGGEQDAVLSEPENFQQPAPSGKQDEMSDFVMVVPLTKQLDSTVQKARAQLIVKSKRQKPSRSHLRKGDSEDDDASSVPTSPATVASEQSSQPSRLSSTDASSPCNTPETALHSSTADIQASSPEANSKTEEKGATSPQEGTPTGKSRLRFLGFRAQLRNPSRRSVNKESRSSTHGSPRVSQEIQDAEGSNGPAQPPSQLLSSSCMPFFFNRKSSLSSTSSNDPPSLNTSPEKRRSKVEEVTPETGGAVSVSLGQEVLDWSAEQVGGWLKELEKGQYSTEFVKQAVTGAQLLQLDGSKLKALGVGDSNDRTLLKKKIKEIKLVVEKERKAQEKLEKQREKQRRKEEEQKKTVKATPASVDLDDCK